jgi:hypothetical protein
VNVAHSAILDRRSKLPFGKPGAARDRPVAHVEQCRDADSGEGGEDVPQQCLLVANRVESLAAHCFGDAATLVITGLVPVIHVFSGDLERRG